MATLVLTVIGDDRPGLVDALSGVITEHGGNWDTSRMARLAGKFAGIVMVTVPDAVADGLVAALEPLEAKGLLHITVERAAPVEPEAAATIATMEIFGLDHPGIIHEVSQALAERGVSIDELETETRDAPMAGGTVFEARAALRIPAAVSRNELEASLGRLADALAVEIALNERDEAAT
jgi:glycine cleavage system regulatory protein